MAADARAILVGLLVAAGNAVQENGRLGHAAVAVTILPRSAGCARQPLELHAVDHMSYMPNP